MMRPVVAILVSLNALLVLSSSQQWKRQEVPRVSLVLPPGTPSETVQIEYFASGPSGAFGRKTWPRKNLTAYDIDIFTNGRPATRMRVIAYLPGCEIVTLDFPLRGERVDQKLECKPLGSISLRGEIFPASIVRETPTKVDAMYFANWSQHFFGAPDGAGFLLGTAVPDENGEFEIKLPDLYRQSDMRDGEFRFFLQPVGHGDTIAQLKIVIPGAKNSEGLKVDSSYPAPVRFVAELP